MTYEQQAKAALAGAAQPANFVPNAGCSAEPPIAQASLGDMCDVLDSALSSLIERLERLQERLSPVLRQDNTCGVVASPTKHNVPLLDILEQQTFCVRQLTAQIQGIVDRLVL